MTPNWSRWNYLLPASVLLLTQCGKEEKTTEETVPMTSGAADVVKEIVEEVAPPSTTSAAERAEIVEISGLVRGDVDGVASLIQPKAAVEKLKALKIWDFIQNVARAEGGTDLEAELAGPATSIAPFASEDLSVVYGKGVSDFLDLYLEAGKRMNFHQFRFLAKSFAEGLASGNLSSSMREMEQGGQFAGLADEVDDFLPQLRELQFPPVLMATKISDPAARDQAMEQINGLLAMVGPQAEPVAFESGGSSFTGFRLSGDLVASQLEADPSDLVETFGEETSRELIAIIRDKRIVIASGVVKDYFMIYLGSSEEGCPLTASLEESLAANDRISFVDGFKDKAVHGFLYGAKEVMEATFQTDGLAQVANGVIAGLKDAEGFGDPRELISLLGLVGEREQELYQFYKPDTVGGVISVDSDVSFDLFGGYEPGEILLDTPHRLSSLGDGADTLLFVDALHSPEYYQTIEDYADLLVTIAYSAAEHTAGLESGAPEMAQFADMFQVFDANFREDVVKLWEGLKIADDALGNERTLVVDLAGGVPPLPGVPTALVEKGRMPRISYVAPVTDRAKLGESWSQVDASIRAMLASARKMGAGEINMLVPTNSEKDDFVTWYFDAAAFSDDLKPSITVSDSWFAASTSRTQALDLVGRAAAATEGERSGVWLKLDSDVLVKYLSETAELIDQNGEQIIPNASDLADFREQLPLIREGLKSLEELDAVTIHERREDGRRRVTFRISAD